MQWLTGNTASTNPSFSLYSVYCFRLKREKAAIRDKPEAWASLHAAGSSWGSSRAPSGCLNTTAFSGEDSSGSLASSLTRDPLSLASPTTSQRREPQHHRRRHNRSPCYHPGRASEASLERHSASARLVEKHQRDPPRHGATEDVAGLVPKTAPASLLCRGITDAETGEPLELRHRRWEFPSPSRRADTAGRRGGGSDGPRDSIVPRSWRDSAAGKIFRLWSVCSERVFFSGGYIGMVGAAGFLANANLLLF